MSMQSCKNPQSAIGNKSTRQWVRARVAGCLWRNTELDKMGGSMAWDSCFDADLSLGPALQAQCTAPCHPSGDRSPNLNSDDIPSIGAFLASTHIPEIASGIFFLMSAFRLRAIASWVVSLSNLELRYLIMSPPLGVMLIVVTLPERCFLISS